jgi:hypothetical protein
MNTYEFVLEVKVRVEAYSDTDAREIVEDVFGPGDDCGLEVTDMKIVKGL